MESFKDFSQKCSHDDLELTLAFFYGKVKFAYLAFILEEFSELVENLGAEVDKYS